jgi:hypothetical protein
MGNELAQPRLDMVAKKNNRKATWEAIVTRWFPARRGTVYFHIDLANEPDRPATAVMTEEQAREMVVDLVLRDGIAQPGLFHADIDRHGRIQWLRALVHMGVPEATAREITGITATND